MTFARVLRGGQRHFSRGKHQERQNHQRADRLPAFGDRHLGLIRARKQRQHSTHRQRQEREGGKPLAWIGDLCSPQQPLPRRARRKQWQAEEISEEAEIEEVLGLEQRAPVELRTNELAAMQEPQIVQVEFAADILFGDESGCLVADEMLEPARLLAEEQPRLAAERLQH